CGRGAGDTNANANANTHTEPNANSNTQAWAWAPLKRISLQSRKLGGRDSAPRCPCVCTNSPITQKHSTPRGGKENVAGLNHDFRFTRTETQFCTPQKRALHKRKNPEPNN